MRSLWRILALQWLGGDGSEALTGDSTILEGLLHREDERSVRAFDVQREALISRKAIVSAGVVREPERPFDPEMRTKETLPPGASGRYSR